MCSITRARHSRRNFYLGQARLCLKLNKLLLAQISSNQSLRLFVDDFIHSQLHSRISVSTHERFVLKWRYLFVTKKRNENRRACILFYMHEAIEPFGKWNHCEIDCLQTKLKANKVFLINLCLKCFSGFKFIFVWFRFSFRIDNFKKRQNYAISTYILMYLTHIQLCKIFQQWIHEFLALETFWKTIKRVFRKVNIPETVEQLGLRKSLECYDELDIFLNNLKLILDYFLT